MNAATYTPGPWFVSGPFVGPRLAPDSGIQIKVARVAGDECDSECIANARLIAAAPDLLAALEEAVALADQTLSEFAGRTDECQASYDKACAAIARARGHV